MDIKTLIAENKGTIVDVRTPGEFMGGHVVGSINIPLQELESRLDEIHSLQTPLILCCASGGRSGMAQHILKNQGIDCVNGGGWMEVNSYCSHN
jgi:rhodanese-related sulfurtransferase